MGTICAALAAMAMAEPASAATTLDLTKFGEFYFANGFVNRAGSFDDTYNIPVLGSGYLEFFFSADTDIDYFTKTTFTVGKLNGEELPITGGGYLFWSAAPHFVSGPSTIEVAGLARQSGGYSFQVSFTPDSAVPEPAAWMMMVLGFGAVGYAIRRKTVLRYA